VICGKPGSLVEPEILGNVPMISYAQNLEDVMLNRVFRDRHDGFYVDVGAADPVNISVTKSFYDRGWCGINIEPHPDLFEMLTTDRALDVNLNCGAGSSEGNASFFQLAIKEWSSFDVAVRDQAKIRGEEVLEGTIRIRSLNDILERHSNGRAVDFIKIDVEGWEREVLQGLDLRRFRPTVILIEAINPSSHEPTCPLWEELLAAAEFDPVYFDGVNKFYVPQECEGIRKHFATPPNALDDFTLAETLNLKKDVSTLTALVKKFEAESTSRYDHIQSLTAIVKRMEAERTPLAGQIYNFARRLRRQSREFGFMKRWSYKGAQA
jgi:FkbM family methyltransferase